MRTRRVNALATSVALALLLTTACSQTSLAPRVDERDSNATFGGHRAIVRSCELVRLPAAEYQGLLASPRASTAPDSGDPCGGLEITMVIYEHDDLVELDVHFVNPNEGVWSGELNIDLASESEPEVRYVVVQNVDVEIDPDEGVSLFVTLALPGSSDAHDIRAFGISGEASRLHPDPFDMQS